MKIYSLQYRKASSTDKSSNKRIENVYLLNMLQVFLNSTEKKNNYESFQVKLT